MTQFTRIASIILVLFIVVCSGQQQQHHSRIRQRLVAKKLQTLRQRPAFQLKQVLSKQEAVTPYPTADELKPEVPFEEGNNPDEVYGPPDETYGPPEIDQTPADQLPSEEAPEDFATNLDAEEFQPDEEAQLLRFTSRRKPNKKNISSRLVQKSKTRTLQRLVVARSQDVASVIPANLPLSSPYTSQSQQYIFSPQPFAYTADYQVS